MVHVTTSIEFNCIAKFDKVSAVVSCLSFISLLDELIQVVDVASVMSGVMELHGLPRNYWFEGPHFVRKGFKLNSLQTVHSGGCDVSSFKYLG